MAAHFGRRLRKTAATTAVAAAAVAALSASQAPGAAGEEHGAQAAGVSTPAPDPAADTDATGGSPYYTDLPPLKSPAPSPSPVIGTPVSRGDGEDGIPATVLDAYKRAESELRTAKPGCNLPWQLLAAIGKVESGQARGGRVDADGTTLGRILGPQLDGNGFALIKDTDHGAYDGNSSFDQAVGPMQFIPSTWAWAGRDGNGDGKADPNNVYDAALAAGHYLCRGDRDLSHDADLRGAILSYNHSDDYLNLVMTWVDYYRKGAHSVPDGTGGLPAGRSDAGTRYPTPARPAPTTPPAKTPSRPHHPGGSPSPSPGTEPPHTPDPKPSPSDPAKPPTPSETVDHLADADQGAAKLTATAGNAFTRRIAAQAETKDGKAVAKVRVRFTVTGDTDAAFTGGEKTATVATDAQGLAVAPALQAGEEAGDFKVTATVFGHLVKGIAYPATVTPRPADTLTPVSDAPQICVPGGEFATPVQLKATYKGAAAAKVTATATLVKGKDDPAENDKGPYFKDAAGHPVRTLTLTTDAKGLLTLPKLYADDLSGTYLLKVATPGGGTRTIELTVAPAAPSADPSPSPSASS